MTESEIQEFREKLQTKLNTLAPKKIKGIIKVDVFSVTFEENFLKGYPGSMDILIDPEYDYDNIFDYDPHWISKLKQFTTYLTTALLQDDTRVYVYFR